MAGQAPITSDNKMAKSNASVNQAALCAAHPNRRSASGLRRTGFAGGGLVMSRPPALTLTSKAGLLAGSVEDKEDTFY
jgi:hypothetical protein